MIRTVGKKPVKEIYRLMVLESARSGGAARLAAIVKGMQHRGEITYKQARYVIREMEKVSPAADMEDRGDE